MPIGVPRIIYCWGEELPAQWTDIYNFIFRRRMVFLMQYLDDELCNQICGLLINIHMEDRSKDLERKEMERSGVFKSGVNSLKTSSALNDIKKGKKNTGLAKQSGSEATPNPDATSSDSSFSSGLRKLPQNKDEKSSPLSAFSFSEASSIPLEDGVASLPGLENTFYNKKSKSIKDLLNADEDLGIDEIHTLEEHTLQKITTEWLNWNAQFFDYADEPYLFYLAELLAKDFNKSSVLAQYSYFFAPVGSEATPKGKIKITKEAAKADKSNKISGLLSILSHQVFYGKHFSLPNTTALPFGTKQRGNFEKKDKAKIDYVEKKVQATSDIYAPFRTYAKFSPENFNLKNINSLIGKKKLFNLFQEYKKASFSVLSLDPLACGPQGKGCSEANLNLRKTKKELLISSFKDYQTLSTGAALPFGTKQSSLENNFTSSPLLGWKEGIKKKKYIWKLLLESLPLIYESQLLPLRKLRLAPTGLTPLACGPQGKGCRLEAKGAVDAGLDSSDANLSLRLPFGTEQPRKDRAKGSNLLSLNLWSIGPSKEALSPKPPSATSSTLTRATGLTQAKVSLGEAYQKKNSLHNQDSLNFTNSTKKVLSQRNLRRAYSLDLYDSSEFSLMDANQLWDSKNSLSNPTLSSNSAFSSISPNAMSGNQENLQKGKSPEFRDYYRKQTERIFIEEESKKVFVIINSFGGSVGNGVTVHDALQFIKAGSLTLALGVAASAASLALAGGTIGERYVTEGCHVMIHQPESSLQGQASDIWIDSQEIMKIRLDVAEIYSLSTYRPRHKILRDLDRDFYLTATETIQYGLADEIATNEVMAQIVEMTSKVWDYHDSKQQRLLETRERSLQNTPETEESL
jgi:ATP-dependent Clp protease protease subunit